MTTPTEELIIVKKPKKPATKKDKTQLYLVLKGEYFNEILAGTKTEEYREFTDHNISRLGIVEDGIFVGCREYQTVKFQLGYTKDAPQMVVEVKEVVLEADEDAEEFNIDNCNFTIRLGKILERTNC